MVLIMKSGKVEGSRYSYLEERLHRLTCGIYRGVIVLSVVGKGGA